VSRFTGNYTHAIDAKNRVSVPRKILDTLRKLDAANEVFVTVGLDGCLFLYDPAGFDKIGEEVDGKPMGEESIRDFARNFYSLAQPCSIDRSGRLLLPDPLKQEAGLGDKVVFAGVGKRVELWDPKAWEQRRAKTRPEFESHAKDVFR